MVVVFVIWVLCVLGLCVGILCVKLYSGFVYDLGLCFILFQTVVPAAFAHLSSKGNRGKGDGKGKVVEENVKRKVVGEEKGC